MGDDPLASVRSASYRSFLDLYLSGEFNEHVERDTPNTLCKHSRVRGTIQIERF